LIYVLGGGGLLGEAWMSGVLAGLHDAGGPDPRDGAAFVGTSAGSIVAASLAAGRDLRRPDEGREALERDSDGESRAIGEVLARAAGVAAPLSLAAVRPAGAFVRGQVLKRMPLGARSLDQLHRAVGSWGVAFDGRLRIAAVDRQSGRRVVFGSKGAPEARVADAVVASCAIPGVFRPRVIGGREYVDGGAWSPVNADAAPAGRGDEVLVLEPMAVLLGGALRVAGAVEAAALRRRGASVRVVAPDGEAAPLMGRLMDPDRGDRVLQAGYRQGLALAA
jgi:NTE family protein